MTSDQDWNWPLAWAVMAWIVLGFVLLAIPATNMIGQAVLAAYAVVVAFRFQKEMYGGR